MNRRLATATQRQKSPCGSKEHREKACGFSPLDMTVIEFWKSEMTPIGLFKHTSAADLFMTAKLLPMSLLFISHCHIFWLRLLL